MSRTPWTRNLVTLVDSETKAGTNWKQGPLSKRWFIEPSAKHHHQYLRKHVISTKEPLLHMSPFVFFFCSINQDQCQNDYLYKSNNFQPDRPPLLILKQLRKPIQSIIKLICKLLEIIFQYYVENLVADNQSTSICFWECQIGVPFRSFRSGLKG